MVSNLGGKKVVYDVEVNKINPNHAIGAGRAELANAYADRRDEVQMVPENEYE